MFCFFVVGVCLWFDAPAFYMVGLGEEKKKGGPCRSSHAYPRELDAYNMPMVSESFLLHEHDMCRYRCIFP